MKLIITDVEEPKLKQAAKEISALGVAVSHYTLDVSNRAAYEAVAKTVLKEHGAPYMLFNNAGIAWDGAVATAPIANWEWMVSVNLLGVGYGLSLFVSAMIASGEKGYVINTGSISGLATPFGAVGIYGATKHAIVAISEALYYDLKPHGMHVVVLCPGCVATNIAEADRNRPKTMPADENPELIELGREITRMCVAKGLSPAVLADKTFAALEERRLYVVPHPEYKQAIELRNRQMEAAIKGEPATDLDVAAGAAAQMEAEPLT